MGPLHTDQPLLAGRYRRLESLGAGGMARVYLAEDERLGRRVAIKQLHSDSPEEAARRFQREARLGAALSHPNLVYVFDIATDGESVLIAMEYVEGQTLREEVAGGPLDPERAVEVVRDVAAALDHIHGEGVVHRDVKPGNILIGDDHGQTKLADLGIASAAESTRITRSGTVLGTAAYMAPEQLEGHEAGPAADVYSLAAVAFEALAGRKAREGSTPMEIAHRVATEPTPDLSEAWPAAPRGMADALGRGMARSPGDRPASAGELAGALEAGLAESDRRPSLLSPAPARTYRGVPRWVPASAVAAALALVALIAVLSLGGGGGDDRQTSKGTNEPSTKREERPAEQQPAQSAEPEQPSAQPQASGSPSELNDQAFGLMNQGRYDDAIPLLERAVGSFGEGSQDLTYAYALYNLGRALRLAGRPGEAVPILERRLQIPNQQGVVKRELKAARKAQKR